MKAGRISDLGGQCTRFTITLVNKEPTESGLHNEAAEVVEKWVDWADHHPWLYPGSICPT